MLLDYNADPNIELGAHSPLEKAILANQTKMVKNLIKHKADVNHFNKFTEYQCPLIAAISIGNKEILTHLLDNGAAFRPFSHNIHEPLYTAITRQKYDIAEYLLHNGISAHTKITPVNLEGTFGDCLACPFEITPLHTAVQIENVNLAKQFIDLLLEHGADINAQNQNGFTPLSYMAFHGHFEIAEHLISNGAQINDSAINNAASFQNNEYLSILLDHGGNPNGKAKDQTSPLNNSIFCCGDGFNETLPESRLVTIQLLLKHGAKPTSQLVKKLENQDKYKSVLDLFTTHGY